MRTNLAVPFAQKDEAKRLGAKWDPAGRVWYIENVEDMGPFAQWLSALALKPTETKRPATRPAGNKPQAAGKTIVGINYVERTRICACLPWEVCDTCSATALSQ